MKIAHGDRGERDVANILLPPCACGWAGITAAAIEQDEQGSFNVHPEPAQEIDALLLSQLRGRTAQCCDLTGLVAFNCGLHPTEPRRQGDLEKALAHALNDRESFSIINVHLDPFDRSEALARLGKRIHSQVTFAPTRQKLE